MKTMMAAVMALAICLGCAGPTKMPGTTVTFWGGRVLRSGSSNFLSTNSGIVEVDGGGYDPNVSLSEASSLMGHSAAGNDTAFGMSVSFQLVPPTTHVITETIAPITREEMEEWEHIHEYEHSHLPDLEPEPRSAALPPQRPNPNSASSGATSGDPSPGGGDEEEPDDAMDIWTLIQGGGGALVAWFMSQLGWKRYGAPMWSQYRNNRPPGPPDS